MDTTKRKTGKQQGDETDFTKGRKGRDEGNRKGNEPGGKKVSITKFKIPKTQEAGTIDTKNQMGQRNYFFVPVKYSLLNPRTSYSA